MKKILLVLLLVFYSSVSFATGDITGYWTTIDDETKKAKSVVQIYEYNGKYFGRVVDLFNNKDAHAKIVDTPKILGLDIIWDLKKDGQKYKDGEILDPQKGKVYGCEIWREGNNLIVRGKIAFLGRNQTWEPNTIFKSKSIDKLIPVKPKIK